MRSRPPHHGGRRAVWVRHRSGSHLATSADLPAEVVATLGTERRSFAGNVARMDHPAFARAGVPIGAYAVESSCPHVVQTRPKRPAARWSEPGARALLVLRPAPLPIVLTKWD